MIDCFLDEGQIELRDKARDFVRDKVPRQLLLDMDADKVKYPREYVTNVAEAGLLGLRFPKEYGGRGMGWPEEVIVLEEIGVLGTSLGCLYSLPSIVGEAIVQFGTEEQKEKYLKPTLAGQLFCAEALTEPRGGSDFFGATTTAKKDGDHYILNGQKRFMVGSEGADYFLVYAKTDEGSDPRNSISAFLVDRCDEVEVKHLYGLMGTRGGGTGRVVLRDVKVPAENLVGELNGGGRIFYRMMVPERLTSAAGAIGTARAALEVAIKYADRRKAFGQVIRSFQGVSFKIADSIMKLDAMKAMVWAAAHEAEANKNPGRTRRLVSEAKRFSTEGCWEIVNNAMQIIGGIGYTSVFPVERLLRDARLSMIWTGTSEIMNLIIVHELYKEFKQAKEGRDIEADAPDAFVEGEKIYE